MQVKSIAECSNGDLSLRPLFYLFLSGHLRQAKHTSLDWRLSCVCRAVSLVQTMFITEDSSIVGIVGT